MHKADLLYVIRSDLSVENPKARKAWRGMLKLEILQTSTLASISRKKIHAILYKPKYFMIKCNLHVYIQIRFALYSSPTAFIQEFPFNKYQQKSYTITVSPLYL